MEFKLKILDSEVSKLMRIFNKVTYAIIYDIIGRDEDTVTFSVKCQKEDEELLEILMDELSVTDIELTISIPKNPKIKIVKIDAKGNCLAFDDMNKVIEGYSGLWKDMHKIIYNNSDEDTDFEREQA